MNLAIIIPHGAALRLLTDVLPITEIKLKYNIFVVCDEELISDRILNFCEKNRITLLGKKFDDISSYPFLKRILRNVRAYVYPYKFKNKTLIDFWDSFRFENKKRRNSILKLYLQDLIYIFSCRLKIFRSFFSSIECFFTDTNIEEQIIIENKIQEIFITSFSGVDINDQFLLASKRKQIKSCVYIQ